MLKSQFHEMIEQGRIASVRVVPVPLDHTWCIDAVVRTPLEVGSTTDTVATRTNADAPEKLRKFDSIDAAASFLRSVGVTMFTVDTDDAVSLTNVDGEAVRILETTMRLWADEDDSGTPENRLAAVG